MKRIFGILFILLTASALMAECPEKTMDIWPAKDTMPQNPVLVVTGTGSSIELVKYLTQRRKAYLQCPTDKVTMELMEMHYGALNQVQVIIRPRGLLKSGEKYTFQIEGLKPGLDFTTRTYYIRNGVDVYYPDFLIKPEYSYSHYKKRPDGEEAYASFSVKAKDELPFLYEIRLINVRDLLKEIKYFVPAYPDEIRLGHMACSGEFNLQKGEEYQVVISVMDAAGNSTPAPEEWLRFKYDPDAARPIKAIPKKPPLKLKPKK